jgi:hypothetical protein
MRHALSALILVACLLPGLAGCGGEKAPFALQVVPEQIVDSVPNQRCVLLVTAPGGDGPVRVSAVGQGAVTTVEHPDIVPGEVAEVTVIPQPLAGSILQVPGEGRNVGVVIHGRAGGNVRMVSVLIHVTSEEKYRLGHTAARMRDLFIPWLEQNRPELNITAATEWTGTIVSPHILVVTHYLFFSPEWEMHVFWHVMIPPYDWARIELRRRFVETSPSLAFEIPSRSAPPPLDVHPIEPSPDLWR